MPQLYFFHGLESGPHGQKYHLLKNEFPELESPDFQGMDLEQRLVKAEELTRGQHGLVLVGSSFGGLLRRFTCQTVFVGDGNKRNAEALAESDNLVIWNYFISIAVNHSNPLLSR